MTAHIAGRPVSVHTYDAHGCRCDGCCAAHREKDRRYRARHADQVRVKKREQKRAERARARGQAVGTCTRCGITATLTDGRCRDCWDVAA